MEYLKEQACVRSGVSAVEAEKVDELSLYERLGPQTLLKVSEAFYDAVFEREGWFREIFSNVEKEEAIKNQYLFLVEKFGGPKVYTAKKGNSAIIGRHAPYKVNDASAKEWIKCMEEALDSVADVDEKSKEVMMKYFTFMAFYLSAGMGLVNRNRLVGYGDRPGGYHHGY